MLRLSGAWWRRSSACTLLTVTSLLALSACEGCRNPSTPNGGDASSTSANVGPPTARLYLVSDFAGALEPCGCVKDQLGGMDHFGALVAAEKKNAPAFATLSAGPLFFMDMDLGDDRKSQEVSKADAIASTMKSVGLAALTPGRNDFAAGLGELQKARDASGAVILGANLKTPAEGLSLPQKVLTIGGVKIGVIGVASPDKSEHAKGSLEGVESSAPIPAVKSAVEALKGEGAQAIVVLAAVGRGEAKRIADDNPDLLAILVGSNGSSGDTNTKSAPPERVGDVLIVETANHLQTVGVLDIFIRDAPKTGLIKLADGTGIERMQKRVELSGRIDELRAKIATWENDKSIDPKDVEARRNDLKKLEAEREALDKVAPPKSGSFFRFQMREIREQLGADDATKSLMNAYYKKVNDANKAAFKDKKPLAVAKGEASYVGVDVCTTCHEDARKVWDATPHARAYATLEKGFKEANLDCVSCHVTGYDKPGGSTVTHVADLKNVQCEVCHGPGSLHSAKPETAKIPVVSPSADLCSTCHHPPHVHAFDGKAKMAAILGPGHGKPMPK